MLALRPHVDPQLAAGDEAAAAGEASVLAAAVPSRSCRLVPSIQRRYAWRENCASVSKNAPAVGLAARSLARSPRCGTFGGQLIGHVVADRATHVALPPGTQGQHPSAAARPKPPADVVSFMIAVPLRAGSIAVVPHQGSHSS